MFERYDVRVHIVELNSPCECALAMSDHQVDAVVIPYDDYIAMEKSGSQSGIVMAVAAPSAADSTLSYYSTNSSWSSKSVEVLVGNRSELMQRRQEWQRTLLAYEHARLLMSGEQNLQGKVVAIRERRSVESFINDFKRWSVFGISQQDSLFLPNGLCAKFNPQWHGKHLLQAAVATDFDRFTSRNESAAARDKVR
ncbi:MAG: hypothetical protein IPP40_01315 [bacterium]|nr:hypothetical protein [bacterium]